MADAWRDGETRDVDQDMMRVTLDIVTDTMFGADLSGDVDRLREAIEPLVARFAGVTQFLPLWMPTSANLRLRKAIVDLDDLLYRMIAERRAARTERHDLLARLIEARDEESVSDSQIRDEAMTVLLAGHETTALALGYALYLLARRPEVQEALAREIHLVLGDAAAQAKHVRDLPFAEAVVRETMRLYPPVWAIGREAVQDVTVTGFEVRAGTQLWMSPWTTQRDPRWFDDPLAFRPSPGRPTSPRRCRVTPTFRSGAARACASATRSR